MAIINPASAQAVSVEERTWRATIETPKGGGYSVSIHRERTLCDPQGNRLGAGEIMPPVVLAFDDIKDETIAVAGIDCTVGELTAAMHGYFDRKAAAGQP